MREFLFTLTGLTLGGSAAVCLLALAGRSTRARYGARWRCLAWLLLCLRLAVPLPLLPDRPAQQAPIQLPVVEDRVVLRAFLEALPETERQIVLLHAAAGFRHWEIAKFLHMPLSTVLSKYHRAMKRLRVQIAEDMI